MQRKEDELLHAPTVVGIWKHLDLPRTYAVAEERGQSSEALGHTDMPGKDQAHVAFRNIGGINLLAANRDSPHYKWARNLIKKDIGAIKLNTNTDVPGNDQAHVAFWDMVGNNLFVANRDSTHQKGARNLTKKDIGAIKLNTNLIHGPTVSRPA